MKVIEEVTIGAASFKRCTDMPSSPLDSFKGRLSMILKISAQIAGLRIKVDSVGLIESVNFMGVSGISERPKLVQFQRNFYSKSY